MFLFLWSSDIAATHSENHNSGIDTQALRSPANAANEDDDAVMPGENQNNLSRMPFFIPELEVKEVKDLLQMKTLDKTGLMLASCISATAINITNNWSATVPAMKNPTAAILPYLVLFGIHGIAEYTLGQTIEEHSVAERLRSVSQSVEWFEQFSSHLDRFADALKQAQDQSNTAVVDSSLQDMRTIPLFQKRDTLEKILDESQKLVTCLKGYCEKLWQVMRHTNENHKHWFNLHHAFLLWGLITSAASFGLYIAWVTGYMLFAIYQTTWYIGVFFMALSGLCQSNMKSIETFKSELKDKRTEVKGILEKNPNFYEVAGLKKQIESLQHHVHHHKKMVFIDRIQNIFYPFIAVKDWCQSNIFAAEDDISSSGSMHVFEAKDRHNILSSFFEALLRVNSSHKSPLNAKEMERNYQNYCQSKTHDGIQTPPSFGEEHPSDFALNVPGNGASNATRHSAHPIAPSAAATTGQDDTTRD